MASTDSTAGRLRGWLRSVLPAPVMNAWHGWLRWRIRRNDAKVFRRTGGRIVAGLLRDLPSFMSRIESQ